MLIWRIESENCKGPYTDSFSGEWRTKPHDAEHGCPIPLKDFGNNWKRGWHFGFTSVEQMINWFHPQEIYNILSIKNFRISLYQVDEEYVRASQYQAVFKLKGACLLKTFYMEDLSDEVLSNLCSAHKQTV